MTFPRPFVTILGVLSALLPVGVSSLRADDGLVPIAPAPAAATPSPVPGPPSDPGGVWERLPAPAGKGKQDDVFFTDARTGWYVCGQLGTIQHTVDGGQTWRAQVERPGTYFRCLSFLDALRGFAGNIGLDYFPGVTDPTPLYRTDDGGTTWTAVDLGLGPDAPPVKGLCALETLRRPFINAGQLGERVVAVHAVGRVGGPAVFLRSLDEGRTWSAQDLSGQCGMLLDVHFFDLDHGVLCAGSDADVEKSHALILLTADGGKTWTRAYESARPYELTWKCAFPTPEVGYVTIQSYDPDPKNTRRYVAKTTDAGRSWRELPLVEDAKCREFGVGFLDADTGWVGTSTTGFATADGGAHWQPVNLGRAANKLRVRREDTGGPAEVYAVGVELWRRTAPPVPALKP